jgi:transglutaminase-like putative cysteine protease
LAQSTALERANDFELRGRFSDAAAVLTTALHAADLPPANRKQLEFELDRLGRIKKDFPFTKDSLFAALKKAVKGLTQQEFEEWVAEGRFDSREIDGQRFFMSSSVSNLFFRYPELGPRRLPPKDTAPTEIKHWETVQAIQAAARAEKKPYVLPKRFEVTMKVTAKPSAAPPGEIIHAWLPIPREYPFQSGFELTSASPPVKHIDDPTSPVRSLELEQPAKKDAPTQFKINFDYTMHGVWFDLDPARVKPPDPNDSTVTEYMREAPHVVFTPELRALSGTIIGEETNACIKAKKIYDWIAGNIKYSFAIEYSTIRNISDYCRSRGYGDCGQEALLFIALCRLNGIPARWQSGWNTFPDDKDIHDWSEIYLPPYGWVPVDPYMGIYATRYATSLSPDQRRELRDFYFGGLDQYRMIANSDHSQILNPPKQSMRSDNVDFQRGELEWGNHNIYFDQYSYEFTIKEVKLPRGRVE